MPPPTSTSASAGTWAATGRRPITSAGASRWPRWGPFVGRRRPLTWLLLFLAAATFWLALGAYLLSGPGWLGHPWLPWRELSTLSVLKEILPDQFMPLLVLFLAFLIAVGLDALYLAHGRPTSWLTGHRVC